MKSMMVLLGLLVAGAVAAAEVRTEDITYRVDGQEFRGFLAYPAGASDRPGLLVVHEWWGHNDYVRQRARMLAELGYVALALDMFGDGRTAEHPDQAAQFATAVRKDREGAIARFNAALEALHAHPASDPARTAAIGYCFGGAVALDMARAGVDLDAVVAFHAPLATDRPAEPGKISAELLVLHGAEDPLVPQEEVERFLAEMQRARVHLRFVSFPGATHAFTNPAADANAQRFGLPLGYNAQADERSWAAMRSFLDEVFAQGKE